MAFFSEIHPLVIRSAGRGAWLEELVCEVGQLSLGKE